MTQEYLKSTIRNYLQVFASGDINRVLLFLAKDAKVVTATRTFSGVDEIKKYLTWVLSYLKGCKVTESGIGIIVDSNTGVVEHIISGISNGKHIEIPAVCIYEFKNNKIYSIREFSDKLEMARQAARGPLARWMVNSLKNAIEKGLR